MGYDCGHKSCDSHVCLTERLAQVERERDEWKVRHAELSSELTERAGKLRAERDAALAKAAGYRRDQKEATETALRNMAKAEAAEKEKVQWKEDAWKYAGEAGEAKSALTDLRDRIEALAASWDNVRALTAGEAYARGLRELLAPPKVETALDVLSRLEKNTWPTDERGRDVGEDFAKLRKLLSEQEGK